MPCAISTSTGLAARAAEIDAEVARGGDPGPLAGVPMGVKELVAVAGWPDTHASKVFENDIAERDATESERLRAAGAVLVGLTTSPEFGSTNWTRSYLHGTTRNPWNPEMTPGGSSGGSAAAVSVGMLPIATGSDGGGSIRIPSSYCGLFGFKVSFGRVGDEGPFDHGLTSVPGPMCRSVRDAARYIDAIAGPTVIDPTSLAKPARPYEEAVLSGDAAAQLRGSARHGRRPSASRCAIRRSRSCRTKPRWRCARTRASSSWMSTCDCRGRAGRGPSCRRSSLPVITASVPSSGSTTSRRCRGGLKMIRDLNPEALLTALRRRDELLAAIAAVFDEVDLLFTPTTATTAFVAEGPPPLEIAGQSVGGMGSVPFTAPFNMSGQPGVSIPCGLAPDGLPVGLQVVTRRHDEELVLGCGAIAEANRPWPKFAPLAYS